MQIVKLHGSTIRPLTALVIDAAFALFPFHRIKIRIFNRAIFGNLINRNCQLDADVGRRKATPLNIK